MHVLDSSAVLVVTFAEPGVEAVVAGLPGSSLGTVNLAEVIGVVRRRGGDAERALRAVEALPVELVDFDPDLARATGNLEAASRSHGLSLGDRACLALAQRLRLPILTADRVLAEFAATLPVAARLVR